jgi:pimeloyl-ACP methyl ester carboxylesterase
MSTFVFIHGAGSSAWDWHLVAPHLRERGHDVLAADLPCDDPSAGLNEYADAVLAAIGGRSDLVVVAHSLGGFTAPLVCARVEAKELVLVAGMIPAPGESASDWWERSGHRDVYDGPDGSDLHELFFHDVPAELETAAMAHSRDEASRAFSEPWPLDAWPHVPTRYVLFRDDRLFPAAFARRHARERLGVVAEEIPGGHCAYLSQPAELAERLLAA